MSSRSYPFLSIDVDALDTNIAVMGRWCSEHDVRLAPHVKTTMCRPIVDRQVAAGSSTLTVATVGQALTVSEWGHRDVLIANEVVDQHGLSTLRERMAADSGLRIRCFVDSADGVTEAGRVFGPSGPQLEVMVDVGADGGRTGVRDVVAALDLCAAVARAPGLRLVGVAGYEGVAPNRRDVETVHAVDVHSERTRDVFIAAASIFETDEPVFTMGGSAFPDRAVLSMPSSSDVAGTVRLVRSGCYVTHDHGTYAGVSPIDGLEAALSVHAVVVSAPEPGMVVIGAGRRDLPFDSGFPILLQAASSDGTPRSEAAGRIRTLYDHHAVVESAVDLAVSDVVRLGISHPCSAFDRWSAVVATRREDDVTESWPTSFDRH